MKPSRRSILSRLDDTVRWTGMPARIAAQISGDPNRIYQPRRWAPIWAIAFACALLAICLAWPRVMDEISVGLVVCVMGGIWAGIISVASGIYATGPLGKPALDDDEREGALRKDSFLFCLGLLAFLNCLAQPAFMVLSHWQEWPIARITSVVTAMFILNATLLGCLPTLYASWKLRQLPAE
jgi:hypothetical protein